MKPETFAKAKQIAEIVELRKQVAELQADRDKWKAAYFGAVQLQLDAIKEVAEHG